MHATAETTEDQAIALIESALGERLTREIADAGMTRFDGPRSIWHGATTTVITGTKARIAAELAALTESSGHPFAPRVRQSYETAIAFDRVLERPADASEVLDALVDHASTLPLHETTTTIREAFARLNEPIDIARALAQWLGRSRTDRFLARPITIRSRDAIVIAAHPALVRRSASDGALRALSWRRARAGTFAIELASLDALAVFDDLRDIHRELGGNDEAYEIALIAALAREGVLGRDADAAQRCAATVRALLPSEPLRVAMRVESAPTFLDRARFEGEHTASHARFLMREYDERTIGGEPVVLRTEPDLRVGKIAQRSWRPSAERRREFFSRWERGIRFDDEGLYSATPETIATQLASHAHGVVVDGTCGIGSITIALARSSQVTRVVAIDRNAERLQMAQHNAAIYGVAERVEFLVADIQQAITSHNADVLVIDPPWGGRDYDRARLDVSALGGIDLAAIRRSFKGRIVLKLPPSADLATLPLAITKVDPAFDPRGILKLLIVICD